MTNKKGMMGGVAFLVIILAVMIILSPIILKVGVSVMTAAQNQFSQIDSSNRSASTVGFVKTRLTGTFDWVIMLLFLFDFLLLLVSSFLIDVHPAFIIIYIIGAFCLVVTVPYTMVAAEKIYSMGTFNPSITQYLPMTEFFMNNFGVVVVAILVVTGIVMYAKIKYFSSGGGGSGSY